MRGFLISDNTDTLTGFRLAGTEGVVVHSPEHVRRALHDAVQQKDIAVLYITEKLAERCEQDVQALKSRGFAPLIVVIPDRHGESDVTEAMSRYLAESVGIHI